VYLGGYETELEAARSYDRAVIAYKGDKAPLNVRGIACRLQQMTLDCFRLLADDAANRDIAYLPPAVAILSVHPSPSSSTNRSCDMASPLCAVCAGELR
jgi:hypothetical protein